MSRTTSHALLAIITIAASSLAITQAIAQASGQADEPPTAARGEAMPSERVTGERGSRPDATGQDIIAQLRRELSPTVRRSLSAEFLSDEERRDLRIRHGVWNPGDLNEPADAARAAITRGAYTHPSLVDPGAAIEDRAEALLMLGQLDDAITLLNAVEPGERSIRAQRLVAECLFVAGRTTAADAAVNPVISRLLSNRGLSDDDLAEGVRALVIRDRIRGAVRAQGDYRTMLSLLAKARDEVNRLSWTARVAEAELLYEKSSRSEALSAVREALAYNPSSARAWRLLGELMIDQFDFDALAVICARLDALAARAFPANAGDEPQAHPTSLHSALLRARARLRQSDGQGAEFALLETDRAYESNRDVLAWTAAAAAGMFDDDRVDALLAQIDTLNGTPDVAANADAGIDTNAAEPGSVAGEFAVGRTLAEMRQYAQAAVHLERAAARLPNWAPPVLELGLLEVQSGRDTRARRALTRAVELDPFNIRAANSLTLVTELMRYREIETDHFIIRYREGIDEVLATDMPSIMERIHERVAGPTGFDHEPEEKTVIELMPDHEWFSVRITGMPAIHTVAASTGPVIAFESPQQGRGFSIGHYDWPRVLQHEYAHTVTLSRTSNRIPHWFTEAAAVYIEDAPRDYNTWQLLARAHGTNTLFDLEEINIAFVRPEKPTDRGQAYAQGHWMYQYIASEWGPSAPLQLMDRFASGDPIPVAFPMILGVSADEFFNGFVEWATDQLIAVGVLLPDDVPSIGELLERDKLDQERTDINEQASALDAGFAIRWLAEYPEHPDLLELAATMAVRARADQADADGDPAVDPDTVPLLQLYAKARPVDPMPHRALAKHFLGLLEALPASEYESPEALELASRVIGHLAWLDQRAKYQPVYSVQLAQMLGRIGDLPGAATSAERATQMAPFDADYRELAAAASIRADDLSTARRHIAALTILEPDRTIHTRRLDAIERMIVQQAN